MTARIIPITTNTTIATCIQIHVGDTDQEPTQQHRHSHAGSCADYAAAVSYLAMRYGADRFNRYSILLPAVLGTLGLAVRVFQYWSGLGRAAQAQI